MSDTHAAWLPPARDDILTKYVQMGHIKAEKDSNWFMSLAWAINKKPDQTQGRMLAKAFLFLRDFMPRGLVDDFAHIDGNDVMHYLLCHAGEFAASRHKVARDADLAFVELEKWMSKGTDWKEALKAAETERGKRKVWRAPGLLSPAGMTALLIITHPDAKFRNRIGRLGIQWMLKTPRDQLDIRDGFWRGLNAGNLLTCFRPEDLRTPEVQTLADYSVLFGKGFLLAQKDMRPYLPSWASHLTLAPEVLAEHADAAEDDMPQNGHGISTSSGDEDHDGDRGRENTKLDRLRAHLHPSPTEGPEALESWLAGKLAIDEGHAIRSMWCEHWTHRMDAAENYQEQLIIRSLFLQSLRRLKSLATSQYTLLTEGEDQGVADMAPCAYMLLDIEDGALVEREPDLEIMIRLERKSPPYRHFRQTIRGVSRRCTPKTATSIIDNIAARQGDFFWGLYTHDSLSIYSLGVIELDDLRTQCLLGDSGPDDDGRREELLQEGKIAALKLTNWQLRQLVLPCAKPHDVLTECQLRIFCPNSDPGDDLQFLNLSNALPVDPQPTQTSTPDASLGAILRKLFGKLEQPQDGQTASSPRGAETGDVLLTTEPTPPPRVTQSQATTMPTPTNDRQSPPQRQASHSGTRRLSCSDSPADQPATPAGSVHGHDHGDEPMLPANFVNGNQHGASNGGAINSNQSTAGFSNVPRSRPASSPTARRVSATSPTHQEVLSLFTGKRHSGIKRGADGTPKASTSRLWDITTQDLQAELVSANDALKQELTIVKADLETVKEQLHQNNSDIKQDLKAISEDVRALKDIKPDVKAVKDELHIFRDDLKRDLGTVTKEAANTKADEVKRLSAVCERFREALATVKEGLDRLQSGIRNDVQNNMEGMLGQLQAIKASVETNTEAAPQLGENGWLARQCPAPEGISQQKYDVLLSQAGWFYIQCLGMPDDGVSADEEAINATVSRFPSIQPEHIVEALKHVHMQIYQRPFQLA